MDEIWVLGATGRTGRAVSARLHKTGARLVLVGRDGARLRALADELGADLPVVAGPLEQVLAGMGRAAPGVVVNTVGPFTSTAVLVLAACPPPTHYVDVANELAAVTGTLERHEHAAGTGQTFVTGAGFGVLATESVVLQLCQGQPAAARVRVDALASVALEAGVVGPALAGTIVDSLAAGGGRVRAGRVVPAQPAGDLERLTTPDGVSFSSVSAPTGELVAAWRASGASEVVAGSGLLPSGRAVRAVLPALTVLTRAPAVRRLATAGLARVPLKTQDRPQEFSWAHARVEWDDGRVREGWLRTGDGTDFTADVTAEVTRRLVLGEGRPGAYTPGALFGPTLAVAAGGEFVL